MLEIVKRKFIFILKQIWFADCPFDVEGVDSIAFVDCKKEVDVPGFNRKKQLTFIIDLTSDSEKIWKNFSEGNVRKSIRRANRAGVKIKINQNYEEFYRLYETVADAKGLSGLMSLQDIQKYGTLFVAELNNKIISGHAYLEDKDNMVSWAIGSERFNTEEKSSIVANAGKLIIWEAIKYAKNKGIKEFDFGGYNAGGTGKIIFDKPNWFKQSFGGTIVTRYSYIKDYSKLYKFLSTTKQNLIH